MQAASHWNGYLHELRRFWEEYAAKSPGFRWRDQNADFSNDLAKWYHKLPEQFAQRTLLPDQVSSPHEAQALVDPQDERRVPHGAFFGSLALGFISCASYMGHVYQKPESHAGPEAA